MSSPCSIEDLQAALHQAFGDGIEPAGIALHPSHEIHVSDPALGLPPLLADQIDAIDGIPVVIDPTLALGEIEVRARG
jgi:hypothetical protein